MLHPYSALYLPIYITLAICFLALNQQEEEVHHTKSNVFRESRTKQVIHCAHTHTHYIYVCVCVCVSVSVSVCICMCVYIYIYIYIYICVYVAYFFSRGGHYF